MRTCASASWWPGHPNTPQPITYAMFPAPTGNYVDRRRSTFAMPHGPLEPGEPWGQRGPYWCYSRDLRERVIHQHFTLKMKSTAIAISLNMSLRVVRRVIELWREIGEVMRDSERPRHLRALNNSHKEVRNRLRDAAVMPC